MKKIIKKIIQKIHRYFSALACLLAVVFGVSGNPVAPFMPVKDVQVQIKPTEKQEKISNRLILDQKFYSDEQIHQGERIITFRPMQYELSDSGASSVVSAANALFTSISDT